MTDKKIIISAIILSLLLIGGGWYYSEHGPSAASISQEKNTPIPPLPKETAEGISYGNPDAPVVVEEYFSFLCGACVRFYSETFSKIEEDYIKTGKVRFVFYPYPPYELGQASFCSEKLGKYKEYSAYLYSHSEDIKEAQDLINFATNVGIDNSSFQTCYNSDEAKKAAQGWYNAGSQKSVEATPTFFVNGQKFIGAQPYSEFQKIFDEKLQRE